MSDRAGVKTVGLAVGVVIGIAAVLLSVLVAGAFDRPISPELKGVLIVTTIVTLLFILFPNPIVGGADTAAASLFVK